MCEIGGSLLSLRRAVAPVSYTWGKSIDISCSGWAGVEGCANQDPYNTNADKSVSAYDLPHIFSASAVYGLPFGKGKRFAPHGGVLDYVIGGWQTNAIVSLHSGTPYTLGVSGDIANTGNSNSAGYYERLNLIGDPHLDNPTTAQWFNTKAFAVPANFTYGNLGRNTSRTNWSRVGGRIGVVGMSKEGRPGIAVRAYEWSHRHFPNFVDCRPILVRRALEAAGFRTRDSVMMHMWVPVEVVVGTKVE